MTYFVYWSISCFQYEKHINIFMSIILSFMQFYKILIFYEIEKKNKCLEWDRVVTFLLPYKYVCMNIGIYRCLNLNLKLKLASISLALSSWEYVYKRPTLKTYWTILNAEDSKLCLFFSTLLTLLSTVNMYFYGPICIIKSILYANRNSST